MGTASAFAQTGQFVFSVIMFCLALFGYEKIFGWPDALNPNPKTHKAIKITSP
jgi:hypothetical protein